MERNLTHLSWMEIRDLDKHQGAVVLPIGAIEQHGPHLPVITDSLLVERVLQAALDQLPPHILLWHLPTLPYAKSNEHSGFPGTFSLSAATLSQVVREVAQGIKQAGFRRLVLLNAHGGNRTVLDTLARDIRLELGLMIFSVFPPALVPDPIPTPDEEQRYGIHAGDWETSVMLVLQPELVKLDRVNRALPNFPAGPIGFTSSAAQLGWLTRDWSESGTFGDATVASKERGQPRFEVMVGRLAEVLEAMSSFEIPERA